MALIPAPAPTSLTGYSAPYSAAGGGNQFQASGPCSGTAFTHTQAGSDYLRATLNADYTFTGGTYIVVETHYNGAGASDKANYDYLALLSGTVFNLGRWYGAGILARSLTPLINLSGYGLLNLTDGSGLFGPGLTWSLAENLELTGSMYLFLGSGDTEFGAFSNAYFASLQYYF